MKQIVRLGLIASCLMLLASGQLCPVPINPCGLCSYFLGTPSGYLCYNRELEGEFLGCCQYQVAWVNCVPSYPYECPTGNYLEWHKYLRSYTNDWYCFGAAEAGGVGHWGPGECDYSPL